MRETNHQIDDCKMRRWVSNTQLSIYRLRWQVLGQNSVGRTGQLLKRWQLLGLGGPGVIFIMRQDLKPFLKVLINLREDMRTFPAVGRNFAERHRCGKHYNIWGEEFCVGEVDPQEGWNWIWVWLRLTGMDVVIWLWSGSDKRGGNLLLRFLSGLTELGSGT